MESGAATPLTHLAGIELRAPLAFVFPGGGALCAYQVGVLQAIVGAGVTPDLLVGTSAGGLNAAFLAWNPGVDGLRRVEHVWRNIRRRDLLRLHPGRLAMALGGRRPSFIDNRHGRAFLEQQFGQRRIEDSPIPLTIVATDLATGEAAPLTTGSVVTAVLASTAFPGAYPPVQHNGGTYIDGGVVADVPLDIAVCAGARTAIVIQVPALNRDGALPAKAIDILLRASTFGVEAHGRTILTRPPEGLTVIEIPAPPSDVMTFSIGNAGDVIDQGRTAAQAWLNQVSPPSS